MAWNILNFFFFAPDDLQSFFQKHTISGLESFKTFLEKIHESFKNIAEKIHYFYKEVLEKPYHFLTDNRQMVLKNLLQKIIDVFRRFLKNPISSKSLKSTIFSWGVFYNFLKNQRFLALATFKVFSKNLRL